MSDSADMARRIYAVKTAYAIVEAMAQDATVRPVFAVQHEKTIELAEWLLDDDDDGDGPADFNGDPISPEELREMVNR